MSAPHRGLPLPGSMTLPQPGSAPQPPGLPPAPGPPLHSQGPPPPQQQQQSHMMGTLPAPPQWQGQGADESMRSWLAAKTEEERRKQEEEKTRQETLRLEQRKLEHEMLRTSLDRGIPPPMVPVVFAGMGGGPMSQAALEWAQNFLASGTPHGHAQLLPAQSPEHHRRDSQSQPYPPYTGSVGVPSTPGSAPGPQGAFVPYQGPNSPTRARAHTMSIAGTVSRPLGGALPRLSTSEMMGGPSGVPHHFGQQQAAPPPPQQQPPPPPQQQQQQQQDTQSPSIYFHHWQPPASQASSNQPATPSVDSPRKRKATGPQPAAPAPNTQIRNRSPPFSHFGGPSALGNPPPGRRRGHSRQRSDISAYRSTRGGRSDSYGPSRPMSPGLGSSEGPLQQRGTHSVSSMLSDHPSPRYPASDMRSQGESERRQSPMSSDEKMRGTGAGPGVARERDND